MSRHSNASLAGGAVRGAVAGAVATWVMDQVTTSLLSRQSKEVTEREEAAQPGGQSSVANLVDRVTETTGVDLDKPARSTASQVVHYALGIVPGAAYGALRGRVPFLGAARGLLFGAALWALNDEYLNARLGLSAPWGAYPAETHVRGAVGHLVLGATTDSIVDVLGA